MLLVYHNQTKSTRSVRALYRKKIDDILLRIRPSVISLCLTASFLSSNAQTRFFEEGDSIKGNPKKIVQRSHYGGSNIESVYIYYPSKTSEAIFFYDLDNRKLLIGEKKIEYDNSGNIRQTALYCADGSPCFRSEYSYNRLGEKVLQREVHVENATECNALIDRLSGAMSHWLTGIDSSIVISTYKYDVKKRLQKVSEKSFTICKICTDTVVIKTSYLYNNRDSIVQKKDTIIEYNFAHLDTSLETTDFKYDERGNKIFESIVRKDFGNNGNDSSVTFFTYNSHNTLIEKKIYNLFLAERHSDLIGYGWDYSYDSLDNIEARYFDLYRQGDKSEMKKSSERIDREKKEKVEYDDHGNIIKKTAPSGWILFTREIQYD